jgi:hypothetical protein
LPIAAGGVICGRAADAALVVVIVELSVEAALAIETTLVTDPASTSAVRSGRINLVLEFILFI